MGTEETGFRGLVAAACGERPADAGEAAGRLRIPTMEERALIFHRATHGSGDFSSHELAAARGKILDAMANDIVSRRGAETPDEKAPDPTEFPGEVAGERTPSFSMARRSLLPAALPVRSEKTSMEDFPYALPSIEERSEELDAHARAALDEALFMTIEAATERVRHPLRPAIREQTSYGDDVVEKAFLRVAAVAIITVLSALGAVTLVRIGLDWFHLH